MAPPFFGVASWRSLPAWLVGFCGAMVGLVAGCAPAVVDPSVPAYAPTDQATASAAKSASRPLVLEWPAADRAALEAQRAGGVVVVRYGGSVMEVLRGCRAPGAYRYVSVTPKQEGLVVRDAGELAAAMPIHTASLEARLLHQQVLDVAMTIVGLYQADGHAVAATDLQGDCSGATHVVEALTVGAFEIDASARTAASAGVTAFGAGVSGKQDASREVVHRDGDRDACAKGGAHDASPPYACGAMLRVEVVPVQFPSSGPAGTCGAGLVRQGTACVAVQPDRPGLLDALKSGH
ncbi:MAG TPA: hypothetical protein VIF09_03565 [Polyangiaceae bacterium]